MGKILRLHLSGVELDLVEGAHQSGDGTQEPDQSGHLRDTREAAQPLAHTLERHLPLALDERVAVFFREVEVSQVGRRGTGDRIGGALASLQRLRQLLAVESLAQPANEGLKSQMDASEHHQLVDHKSDRCDGAKNERPHDRTALLDEFENRLIPEQGYRNPCALGLEYWQESPVASESFVYQTKISLAIPQFAIEDEFSHPDNLANSPTTPPQVFTLKKLNYDPKCPEDPAMNLRRFAFFVSLALTTLAVPFVRADETLHVYSGRSKSLVQSVVKAFERESGIRVEVRYGSTSALAVALLEEGDQSPADLFWAQDAGALGALAKASRFEALPKDLLETVSKRWRSTQGEWVATSGRARVLAYAEKKVQPQDLPQSIFELTEPKWRGQVGWAPTNGSFQAFVTGMRKEHGDAKTKAWLQAMKANGAKAYPKNTPILKALAAGEVTVGIPNHYYLLRFKSADSGFPVSQTFFKDGDIGNLMNVAGVGVLKTTKKKDAALKFVRFLLSKGAQQYFTSGVFEYPVIDEVIPNARLESAETLQKKVPQVDLDVLEDLPGTLELLRQAGVL